MPRRVLVGQFFPECATQCHMSLRKVMDGEWELVPMSLVEDKDTYIPFLDSGCFDKVRPVFGDGHSFMSTFYHTNLSLHTSARGSDWHVLNGCTKKFLEIDPSVWSIEVHSLYWSTACVVHLTDIELYGRYPRTNQALKKIDLVCRDVKFTWILALEFKVLPVLHAWSWMTGARVEPRLSRRLIRPWGFLSDPRRER